MTARLRTEPTPPPTCEGYSLPPGGIRRDRATGQWFADTYEPKVGSTEYGPFDTEDEARSVLIDWMSSLTR